MSTVPSNSVRPFACAKDANNAPTGRTGGPSEEGIDPATPSGPSKQVGKNRGRPRPLQVGTPHKNTNNDLSTNEMASLDEPIPRKKRRGAIVPTQNSPTQEDHVAAIRASVTPSPTMVSPTMVPITVTQPKEGPKESLELPRIIFDKAASGLPKFGLVVGREESRWTDTFWHSQRSLPEAQAALSQMVDSFFILHHHLAHDLRTESMKLLNQLRLSFQHAISATRRWNRSPSNATK